MKLLVVFVCILQLQAQLVVGEGTSNMEHQPTNTESESTSSQLIIGEVDGFKILNNNNITRAFDHFAGELSQTHCSAYCLSKQYKYGGHESDGFCWCGNEFSDGCSNPEYCLKVVNGYKGADPLLQNYPKKSIEMFTAHVVEMNLDGGLQYGVVKDNRLELHTSKIAQTIFTRQKTKLKMEYQAFWGAATAMVDIEAYVPLKASLSCPSETETNKEVCCYLTVVGTNLSKVEFVFDGETRTTYSPASESIILHHGGNMETSRYEEYILSHETNVAFININNEFTVDGLVRAFEAYITRTGEITFMVLRPTCFSPEKQYDNYEKKCIAKDSKPEICSDLNTYCAPDGKPTFCMENNRFGEAGDYVCENAPAMDNVEIDFDILFAYQVNATRLGTMTFIPSEHFRVQPGYVLGWGGTGDSPGDIAYYAIDPEYEGIQRRFRYENITKFVTGGHLSQAYTPVTENYCELIEVTVVTDVVYEECFNATKGAGSAFTMASIVQSGQNETKREADIVVSEPIDGLGFLQSKYTIGMNEILDFSNEVVATTGKSTMTTCVWWGDEQPSATQAKCPGFVTDVTKLKHTYQNPGEFTITIKSYNKFGEKWAGVNVTVMGVVYDVYFVDYYKNLPPIKIGDNIEYCFIVDGNGIGNITIDCKPKNETSPDMSPVSFQMDMAPLSLVCFSTPTYLADLHCCSVGVQDSVNFVDECIHVQQVVEGLAFNKVIATTNEEVTLSVNDSLVGTNRSIKWTSEQKDLDIITMPYVHNVNHTFNQRGWHILEVCAFNQVSNQTNTFPVFVEDRIKGITFLGTPFNTRLKENTKVYAVIGEGSAMGCTIAFDSFNTIETLFVNELGVQNKLYIFSEYLFHSPGYKNVVISCSNNNTNISSNTAFYVQTPIQNVTLKLTQEFQSIGQEDLEIDETVYLNVIMLQGDNVTYTVDWGDGYNNSQNSPNFSYAYPNSDKYKITVSLNNLISSEVVFSDIEVLVPVQPIRNLNIDSGPASTVEIHQMQLTVESGDLFSCNWKIDDGDCEKCSFEQSYTDFLKKRGFVEFYFKEDKKYNVCVSCVNRLYKADTCTDVYAYNPISLVSLYVFSYLSDDPRTRAKGERNNLYDYDFPVLVETTIETGTNVTVHYDFGYSYENGTRATAIEYPHSNTTHKFLLSEDRNMDIEYKITVIVRNAISKGELILDNNRNVKKIKLISAVKPDFSISSGKNNVSILLFTTNFSITFYSLPYRPCCLLDPGEKKDGKTYYFGGEECSTYYGLAQYEKELEIEKGEPIELYRYYYMTENYYLATIQCRNDLAVVQTLIGVNVLDYPCAKPEIKWEVPLSVYKFKPNILMKCEKSIFRIMLQMNCEKLNVSVRYIWHLKMVFDRNGGIAEASDQPISGLNKTFEIKARTLQYGTYMLLVNATMMQRKDNVTINPVADTTATLFGYFKVIPCKLIGKFKGGGGKAAYQKSNLTIDASECEDPNEQGGGRNKLTYNWGCYNDRENITIEEMMEKEQYVTYPDGGPHIDTTLNETLQSGKFEGCLGTGPGLLYGGGIWNIAAKDMLNLQLRYFIPNKAYTVFLHIKYISPSEGTDTLTLYYRLTVTSESVPDVALVDITNQGPRINPTFRKKYSAKCYNCEDYDKSVSIDWKISLLGEKTAIDVTPEMGKFLRYRLSKNDARLIVKEHGFTKYAGTQLVQVKVEFRYKEAPSNDTYGYSVIVFTVNPPPDITNAKCEVLPLTGGQSLRTKFRIRVEDVVDTDLPLKFLFTYKKSVKFVDIGFKKGIDDVIVGMSSQFKRKPLNLNISRSSKVSDEFVLPSGVTQIDVVAIDKEEVKSEQFSCPANVQDLKVSIDTMIEILTKSISNGNAQELSNQVNSMLDVMEDDEDFTAEDRGTLISFVIMSIPKTEVNSKESAIAVSDLINKIVPQAGLQSMDEVDAMVKSLKNIYRISLDEFTPDERSSQLDILFSASERISKNLHGNTSDEVMAYIFESEADLAGQQAATLQPGEETTISTQSESISIQCAEISFKSNDSVTIGEFVFPYSCVENAICESLKKEMEAKKEFYYPEDCIPREILGLCLQMKFTIGANRFAYDIEGAKHIYEDTLSLFLYDKSGKTFTIDHCNKTITYVIENTEKEVEKEKFVAYTDLWLQYHEIEIQYNHTSMFVTVKPVNNTFTGHFAVYFGKDFQPRLDKPDYACILPKTPPSDIHTWETYKQQEWYDEKKWRCHLAQHLVGQKTKGRWLIGVLYIPEKNYHQKKTKRDVSWNKDELMLPEQLKSRGDLLSDVAEDDEVHKVEYSFQAYTRSCQKRGDMAWDSEGVTVSDDTVKKQTICQTVKLAVFGGGGPFAPNKPIDFTKPFREFDDVGRNAIVFAIFISFLVLYLLMLLWARRKDLRDLEKRKIAELSDNHPDDKCFYEIYVQTGAFSGSSTSADVFITINGDEAESAPRQLKNPVRECFQRNYTDVFLMSSPYTLGSLTSLKIWHNNKGYSPGWFLSQVQVHCLETRQKYLFVCDEWLDVAESDHKIIRKLDVIDKEDLSDFEYIFTQASRKNFYDGHIWLSLFTRPVQSNFSAVQRLTTIFATILMMMLANAMFYTGDERPPTDSMKLAYFYVSFSEVKIGLIAALIVLPAVFLIIMLYRYAGPRGFKDAERYKVSIEEALLLQAERGCDSHNRIYKDNSWLPHWLIYIAYALCYVLMAVCAFFTIHIGFQYGKTKADQWIVSLMLSFLHSIIILWPLMVVTYSAISTAAVKQPPDIEEVDECQRIIIRSEGGNEYIYDENDQEAIRAKVNMYKLPDANRLEESRIQRFKDKRIKIILKEIFVHLSFVVLCLMVCYAAVDPNSQRLYQSAHDLIGMNGITNSYFDGKTYQSDDRDADGNNKDVQTGPDITNRAEWFDWARYSVIEYLFPTGWYNQKQTNNKFPYKSGFIADSASSKVLAMARFRQLRLKDEDTCTKHEVFEHLITQCNGPYSYTNQQNKSFNIGWKTFNDSWNEINRIGKRPTLWRGLEGPWKYSTMDELQNFDFFGRFATYDGASYSVSIGPRKRIAKKLLYSMKDNFWIDRRTRAIFAEANVYNANTNLLLLITFLHEILPTGGWNYYPNVQVIRLYRYVGGFGDLIIFFDLAFLIVTFYGLYKIIKNCKKQGCKTYMSNLWNLLHVIVTSCSIIAFLITIVRLLEVKYKIIQYTEKPEEFVSFSLVSLLENLTIGCFGFLLFFTNLEFLRILRFNHQIALMSKTMSILGAPLGSFGMTFFVIFMAYVSLSHCLFVDKLEDFRTPMETLVSLARMFMGQFDINDYFDNAPYLGPILFFTYMISVQMVMINLFVGLICDAYAESGEAQDDDSEAGEKPNLISFVKHRVKNIGKDGVPIVDPIYSDWKDEWEVMLDSFHDRCENCVFVMRNIESEEIRQLKFFEEDVDEKKKNVLMGVVGVDYYLYDSEFSDGLVVLEKRIKEMNEIDANEFKANAAFKKLDFAADKQSIASESSSGGESSDEGGSDDEEYVEDGDDVNDVNNIV